jgi:hypothetical protein
MKPFVLKEPAQFRPAPPVALESEEFARSYNELREYGGKASTKRSPQQSEIAAFWLMVGPQAYHPLLRQICTKKALPVVDCARMLAIGALAMTDAYIAVYEAKYHYEFWRPITAIRNGDMSGNPNTPRDATWQPIADTPAHPEYPCAHCILSGATARVIELLLAGGALPELSMSSVTASNVTIAGRPWPRSPRKLPMPGSGRVSITAFRRSSVPRWAEMSANTWSKTRCCP